MPAPAPIMPEAEDLTQKLADHASGLRFEALPADVVTWAKHCFLDWLGVTLAGTEERLTTILREEALEEGGNPQATIVGLGKKTSLLQAALVNGAAGHALDYDDVALMMTGHPTVPVVPPALALGERDGKSGRDFITALVAGIDTECRIGALMNDGHYLKGWHSTGTVGTFGAAASAASMLKLDAAATANAFGIAGTQAAGLKSMFGTMCKPFHAGKAAANGLYAALLSARGYESRPDVLECVQGFGDTQTSSFDPAAALNGLGESFAIRTVLFKYHAACYGTHAAIEATGALKRQHNIDPANVAGIEVRVPEGALKMCNIQAPATGLEGKFSLRFTTAMAMLGESTGRIANYNEAMCADPNVVDIRDRVSVVPKAGLGTAQTEVVIRTRDGGTFTQYADLEVPESDLVRQQAKLEQKFRELAAPIVGTAAADRLVDLIGGLENARDLAPIVAAFGPKG